MDFSDYFRVIGCRLIMSCYVGHSIRDFFLKDTITPQKGVPIRLNHIIYDSLLEKITQVMSYTHIAITEFIDTFFQRRQMQEGCNKTRQIFFPIMGQCS